MNSPTHPDAVYDLLAVSNHYGNMGFGHYTATCLHNGTGTWHEFNDSHVAPLVSDDRIVVRSID